MTQMDLAYAALPAVAALHAFFGNMGYRHASVRGAALGALDGKIDEMDRMRVRR